MQPRGEAKESLHAWWGAYPLASRVAVTMSSASGGARSKHIAEACFLSTGFRAHVAPALLGQSLPIRGDIYFPSWAGAATPSEAPLGARCRLNTNMHDGQQGSLVVLAFASWPLAAENGAIGEF